MLLLGSKKKDRKLDFERLACREEFLVEEFKDLTMAGNMAKTTAWLHSKQLQIGSKDVV